MFTRINEKNKQECMLSLLLNLIFSVQLITLSRVIYMSVWCLLWNNETRYKKQSVKFNHLNNGTFVIFSLIGLDNTTFVNSFTFPELINMKEESITILQCNGKLLTIVDKMFMHLNKITSTCIYSTLILKLGLFEECLH